MANPPPFFTPIPIRTRPIIRQALAESELAVMGLQSQLATAQERSGALEDTVQANMAEVVRLQATLAMLEQELAERQARFQADFNAKAKAAEEERATLEGSNLSLLREKIALEARAIGPDTLRSTLS